MQNTSNRLELIQQFEQASSLALFDEQTVAAILSRSVQSIQLDRLKGSGVPYVKIGRLVRYSKDSILKWLKAREFNSTSQYQTGVV